ncbi:hypothetical protein M408DRAFT_318524 [Serendipita vermifera MAFF 305830]|uniref:EthD domain-containing protein n=1 Tax=Serendipita vermifera MAFF 305830 TaxID=933852 RepID=A0A0C2WCQ0_SERVB|nr:hypothetical protein M408DRAFT_318524 [Serendipita vermifera MAFF 305830]
MPVRVLSFIKKDPKISSDEFQRYWREVHAPKTVEYMRKYGVQFYSQTYMTKMEKDTINQALFEGTAATLEYDGIAHIVFSSMEQAKACWKDPGYLRIMQEDADFLTQGRQMCVSSGEERIIFST